VFILSVVALLCQYHGQVTGWKDKTRLKMTDYVSSHSIFDVPSLLMVEERFAWKDGS